MTLSTIRGVSFALIFRAKEKSLITALRHLHIPAVI